LGAAPALSAFGPWGALAGLLAGGAGAGLKYFGNKKPKQFNAQTSPIQQQLMNLGPSESYNSPFAGKLDINPGFQATKLKPLGALA